MQPTISGIKSTETMFDLYTQKIEQVKTEIAKVVIGQEEMIQLIILSLLAKGHNMLEGVPGLAKILAVDTFAKEI
jgi:MoxR-like ATPase